MDNSINSVHIAILKKRHLEGISGRWDTYVQLRSRLMCAVQFLPVWSVEYLHKKIGGGQD